MVTPGGNPLAAHDVGEFDAEGWKEKVSFRRKPRIEDAAVIIGIIKVSVDAGLRGFRGLLAGF